jgi:hypothetical protein
VRFGCIIWILERILRSPGSFLPGTTIEGLELDGEGYRHFGSRSFWLTFWVVIYIV